MGFIGFAVKLIHIPINNILVGPLAASLIVRWDGTDDITYRMARRGVDLAILTGCIEVLSYLRYRLYFSS